MNFEAFRRRTRFGHDELAAFAGGTLLEDAPASLPGIPGFQLLPFHEVTKLSWDEGSGTGVIEAVRRNRLDDWFYGCHFLGDPVMPGCWGVDGVWQCLKFFAAWRGLSGCSKTLGMENVSFFGQIRPHDKAVTYRVEIVSVERDGDDVLLTGKASVSVDGTPVYTIESAQIGTAFWQAPEAQVRGGGAAADGELLRALTYSEFRGKTSFSRAEIIALSRGALVGDPPGELPLLPSDQMLEVGRIESLSGSLDAGEGEVLASRGNSPLDWYYALGAAKPTALSIDAVWQLIGVFHAWGGSGGTGRALGLERVEVFDDIRPSDRDIRYEIRVVKVARAEATGDAFVRADALVFADGRPVLSVTNANVGCHKNIRYSDYPVASEMGFGGKLKTRKEAASR